MDEVKWLIAREIPRLRRYAAALADSPEAADDLVQDCLERAIRKRGQWKREGSIRGWLYRILYTTFLNQSGRRRRRRDEVPIDDVAGPTVPARQEAQVICSDIAAAMRRLPAEQRAAIALTALEGMSYEEAARVLRVPIGTVRSRLFRGRERLNALAPERPRAAHLRRVK